MPSGDFELVVGAAIGALLVSAFIVAPVFRNLLLSAAATAILFIYFSEGGVTGILHHAKALLGDLLVSPDFAKGLAAGAIVASRVVYILRSRPRKSGS